MQQDVSRWTGGMVTQNSAERLPKETPPAGCRGLNANNIRPMSKEIQQHFARPEYPMRAPTRFAGRSGAGAQCRGQPRAPRPLPGRERPSATLPVRWEEHRFLGNRRLSVSSPGTGMVPTAERTMVDARWTLEEKRHRVLPLSPPVAAFGLRRQVGDAVAGHSLGSVSSRRDCR